MLREYYPTELSSQLWHQLFVRVWLPKNGTVVEVAPGYEPKIGNALKLFGFRGTIFLVEPDAEAAISIQKAYRKILPRSTVKIIQKFLHEVDIANDIPPKIDAVVASHPFDDMVMATIVKGPSFFADEKEKGTYLSPTIKKIYNAIRDEDYARGVRETVRVWKDFVDTIKPGCFIASQYPSHMLTVKKLFRRQESGFAVLKKLKSHYRNFLIEDQTIGNISEEKGNMRWWIVAQNSHDDLFRKLSEKPAAIARLGETIFVPHRARILRPEEYQIVYIDYDYFRNKRQKFLLHDMHKLALILENSNTAPDTNHVLTYADRQKDASKIGLCGNEGSGRAVYYGKNFNILGVGKTSLCKSIKPSHCNGNLELVGAMRRVVLSHWINDLIRHQKRTPVHPLLIARKETGQYKWSHNPIPLCLLVRVDDGSLDRPSHVEQSPEIPIDFEHILKEYARLDAEYFAYRFLLGVWSTSNYSLNGHMIDLESASFVRYHGPYYTSSSQYPHCRFGYEELGFLRILRQLARVKGINVKGIKQKFLSERQIHAAHCMLLLLGVSNDAASSFFLRHQNFLKRLSSTFERLAKKVVPSLGTMNAYLSIAEGSDPSLLDVPNFFRNLARIYEFPNARMNAIRHLLRTDALLRIKSNRNLLPSNQAEAFIQKYAMVRHDQKDDFLHDMEAFIADVFCVLELLDSEGCLGGKSRWEDRLYAANHALPAMHELNQKLFLLAESYRTGKRGPKSLGKEVHRLCKLAKLVSF